MKPKQREAIERAIACLEYDIKLPCMCFSGCPDCDPSNAPSVDEALDALRAALAEPEPEPEPVAWGCFRGDKLDCDLVGTEADVDFWSASDEEHLRGLTKKALYTKD